MFLDRLLDDTLEETMQDSGPQSLPSEPHTSAVVVRLSGEFDRLAERLFMSCVEHLISYRESQVLFDFGRVRFSDAAGLRCLLQAHRRFRIAGKRLVVVGLPPAVERILALMGLRNTFTVYDDLEAAAMRLVETRVQGYDAV